MSVDLISRAAALPCQYIGTLLIIHFFRSSSKFPLTFQAHPPPPPRSCEFDRILQVHPHLLKYDWNQLFTYVRELICALFLPGILVSCYCYHTRHTSLRVCLEPGTDGRLQGYASCAECEQSGMISPGERSGSFFLSVFLSFFLTYRSQSICVRSHSETERQPTSFGSDAVF